MKIIHIFLEVFQPICHYFQFKLDRVLDQLMNVILESKRR